MLKAEIWRHRALPCSASVGGGVGRWWCAASHRGQRDILGDLLYGGGNDPNSKCHGVGGRARLLDRIVQARGWPEQHGPRGATLTHIRYRLGGFANASATFFAPAMMA